MKVFGLSPSAGAAAAAAAAGAASSAGLSSAKEVAQTKANSTTNTFCIFSLYRSTKKKNRALSVKYTQLDGVRPTTGVAAPESALYRSGSRGAADGGGQIVVAVSGGECWRVVVNKWDTGRKGKLVG